MVLIDIEFDSVEERYAFVVPEFCLVEVTQKRFIAGGTLAGKKYKEAEDNLLKYGYGKIVF